MALDHPKIAELHADDRKRQQMICVLHVVQPREQPQIIRPQQPHKQIDLGFPRQRRVQPMDIRRHQPGPDIAQSTAISR